MRPSPAAACRYRAGGFAGRQYPGGMAMGAGGGLLFWLDQGGPELELTAEFPDKAVPVSISLGELGGMNGTPVFVPADENYYKVWVDVSAQVTGRTSIGWTGAPARGSCGTAPMPRRTSKLCRRPSRWRHKKKYKRSKLAAAEVLKWGFGGGL